MLSSLPCFYAFCWSAIPTSCYIFNVLFMSLFFSSRYMLEMKFAIYHRAASLPSQASSADVCSIGWRIIDQTRLSSNTPCTPTVFLIQQFCIIITFRCWVICVHAYTWRKIWRCKGSYGFSVSGSNRLVWLQTWKKAKGWCTAQWKMLLFSAKTIVKESRKFELAHLEKKKKKKKKKKEKTFWPSGDFLVWYFVMLFSATGCVKRHENTRRWTVGCYNSLKVSCFEDFEKFFVLA